MPDQPLQTTTAPSHVIWKSEETELLLDWMEENTDLIGGIQTIWHQAVKAAVFSDKDHITLKKINDKAQNMKRSYRRAKQLQFQSDFGLRAEDNPQHNNERLEKLCRYFWRLDAIWSNKPATARDSRRSLQSLSPAAPTPLPDAEVSQPMTKISSSQRGAIPDCGRADDDYRSRGDIDEEVEMSETIRGRSGFTETPQITEPDEDEVNSEPLTIKTERRRQTQRTTSKRPTGSPETLQALNEARGEYQDRREAKRWAYEKELESIRMSAEHRLQREQITSEARTQERVAQIQADIQRQIAEAQMENQLQIARINAETQRQIAEMNASAMESLALAIASIRQS